MTAGDTGSSPPGRTGRGRIVVIAAVVIGLAGLIAANVHLVYLALRSQPECVPHIKDGSGPPGARYAPARSAC